MDEKCVALLETLAAKFDTTSEHLWGVLVKQALISATTDLVVCLGVIAATIWWVRFVLRKTRNPAQFNDNQSLADWSEGDIYAAWGLTAVICLIVSVVVVEALPDIVAGFANPEYWALKQLIH